MRFNILFQSILPTMTLSASRKVPWALRGRTASAEAALRTIEISIIITSMRTNVNTAYDYRNGYLKL